MDKEQFLTKIKDILVDWCENRVKNYNDIDFKMNYCSGKTFIRFTTKAIDSILPPTNDNKGDWKNGHYIFYEINNRRSKLNITCQISQVNIYPKVKETCKLLINLLDKKSDKEDWKTKTLESWKLYKYKENENIKDIEYEIIESLNNFMNSEIRYFENNLLALVSDNFDEAYINIDEKPNLWTFFANPKYWEVDSFLKSDMSNNEIYYSINKDHRERFKIGDKGIIRVGKDNRNKSELKMKQKLNSGIYAIVEVVSNPEFRKDTSSKFYANPSDINKDKWRVKIKVIKNLVNYPIIFDDNNKVELSGDKYLINGFQRATMPLKESVFNKIIDLVYTDKKSFEGKDMDLIDFDRLGNDKNGIRILNEIYQNVDIKKKEKLIKVIERGKIASEIKKHMGYKCQVCEALGMNPYSFKKRNGEYYVETHHIIPVADTEKSKLSVENLICVCPNHHRQIHYGNVDIGSDNKRYIEYKIDGEIIKIEKILI